MMILVYVVALFAVILSVLIIIVAVSGVRMCKMYQEKGSFMPEGESEFLDAYNDVGISIVASGFRELSHVKSLLSLNHLRYEVVLLMDMELDDYADELLEEYAMVAIDKTPSDELPCNSVRAVYRSRQRRYHKLVIVDRSRTTLSHEFNCGVNLCSYEYVVSIDGWSRFNQNALQHIVTELFEQYDHKRIYAIGGFKVGNTPRNKIRIIDTVMRMVVLGAGMSELSNLAIEAGIAQTSVLGRYVGTMILFDREALIDAGGYRSDFFPDAELYARIRKTIKYRHADGCAVFVPQVLAYEDGEDQLSGSSLPLMHASFIERVISRRVSTVFYGLCLALLIVAVFIGNPLMVEIILLTLFLTYFVALCVAALSLTVADKLLLNHFHDKSSLQLILSLVLYPFFLLYCLLSPKKFY